MSLTHSHSYEAIRRPQKKMLAVSDDQDQTKKRALGHRKPPSMPSSDTPALPVLILTPALSVL